METGWIEDFLALVAAGGFSRAAAERGITQPAFGRRIAQLERWVGAPLVDRSDHRLRLTPAGESFRGDAAPLLRDLASARARSQAKAAEAGAAVTMASTHMLASSVLPQLLARAEAPGTTDDAGIGRVQLIVDTMAACEAAMQAGRMALLLCHHHDAAPSLLDDRSFARRRIAGDRLVAVSAPDAQGRPLHRLEEDERPVAHLAFRGEAGLARILDATVLPPLDGRLQPVFASHAALTLLPMAIAGRGLAFLPESLVAADLAAGRLVRAGDAEVAIDICLIRRRARQTPAFEALWSSLSKEQPSGP